VTYEDDPRDPPDRGKPTALIALYRTPELKAVAEEVEGTLVRIMEESAR
jgi:hypothetical protein